MKKCDDDGDDDDATFMFSTSNMFSLSILSLSKIVTFFFHLGPLTFIYFHFGP